jgi:anaerobic dimethyl sulfoxide reductase subunit C (anchor subunit)
MEIQWSLILFTLFVALGAGLFALQGLFAALGRGAKLQLPALVVSFIAIVLGGIFSFTHLQHWDRAFNGFGHLTSGITQELIGIVVVVVVMAIYFVLLRKGEVPRWAGVLALIVGAALVIVMATSYMMPARPVWATPALYLFYLAQAVVAGAAALWLVASGVKAEDSYALGARVTAVGGVLVLVSLAVYAGYISTVQFAEVGNYFDPTHPTKAMADPSSSITQLTTGSLALYFWGAVIVGGVIPALLGFLKWKKEDAALPLAALALIAALAGGLAFRVALYGLGGSVFIFY